MTDFQYTPSPASLGKFFSQIQTVGKPSKVTYKWLSSIGFKSSNDRYVVGILKSLGFTDNSATPTSLWLAYRNKAQGRAVMAQGLHQAYQALFDTYPDAYRQDDDALRNFFSTHTDVAAGTIAYMVRTFKALVELADFDAAPIIPQDATTGDNTSQAIIAKQPMPLSAKTTLANASLLPITMNIQIVIPSDASADQYDKIFSSIKKFLTKQD